MPDRHRPQPFHLKGQHTLKDQQALPDQTTSAWVTALVGVLLVAAVAACCGIPAWGVVALVNWVTSR